MLTLYKYDSFGALTNTAYSDGTPSIAFTLNALGQMKTVTDASGTRTIDYAADGQMIAEALAFNTSLFTLHEKYDTLGRNQGYALSNGLVQVTGTMQNFDLYGRLNQVAVDGISGAFTYGYLEGTHLQKTLAMPNGVTRTFGYEPNRDLLTTIIHSNATDRLVQRDFTFDGLGRLIDRTLVRASGSSSSAPDAFAYNSRSELTNAVIGANAFAYNFDPIGNRKEATEFGTNTAYMANSLNQYTQLDLLPPTSSFLPQHDADGNQLMLRTTTGIWHVWYNAENRPILFSNDTTKVEMAYDYMGRRFEYKETVDNTLTRHERYLYRGYLQIAALDMLASASVKHAIVWDATEPTATRPLALQIGANAYFYSFDLVKNVTEIFDSAGALAATYDYSPFGQITSVLNVGSSMFNVRSNPITFSSEVFDLTLGLQYYNYRHLDTLHGRWVNRDPSEESGGANIYGVVENKVLLVYDILGLWSSKPSYGFDDHSPFTKEAIDKISGALAIPQETIDQMKKRIVKGNLSVDTGDFFKNNYWHYNRDVGDPMSFGRIKYDQIIVGNGTQFFRNLSGNRDNDDICKQELLRLGRLSHAWQDYYAHAVSVYYKVGTHFASDPSVGSISISSDPYHQDTMMKPSSYDDTTGGEHGKLHYTNMTDPSKNNHKTGMNEPGNRAPDRDFRRTESVNFTAKRFRVMMQYWYDYCSCSKMVLKWEHRAK